MNLVPLKKNNLRRAQFDQPSDVPLEAGQRLNEWSPGRVTIHREAITRPTILL